MPQMMPLNWLLLLVFFLSIFLLFNMLNYYIININNSKNNKKSFNFNNLNWKW